MHDLEAIALLQDPARRSLYDFVVAAGRAVSRNEAAQAVGVQRTLAAFHLDRLANAGLLAVAYRRANGRSGPGAGRPAKLYSRTSLERAVSVPARDYGRAAQVLADAVERSGAEQHCTRRPARRASARVDRLPTSRPGRDSTTSSAT
jgi:predicted ArsR family transcriptional regulator